MERADHYKYFADYQKASTRLLRIDAFVHVEGKDDKPFWESIFARYLPNKKLRILTQSFSGGGSAASGVSQCLKYRPWLDERFFICIDSDYRYLLQEPDIDASHFVFQTYTYSIENHYCYENRLNDVCFRACGIRNTVFDFSLFLRRYSEIVFEVFLWHLYFQKTDPKLFTKGLFNSLTALKRESAWFAVHNNGDVLLDRMRHNVIMMIAELQTNYPHTNLDEVRQICIHKGVTPATCYLFIRGHDLYDGLLMICKNVCDELLKQKRSSIQNRRAIYFLFRRRKKIKHIFDQGLAFDAYPEIARIGEDLKKFSQNH